MRPRAHVILFPSADPKNHKSKSSSSHMPANMLEKYSFCLIITHMLSHLLGNHNKKNKISDFFFLSCDEDLRY